MTNYGQITRSEISEGTWNGVNASSMSRQAIINGNMDISQRYGPGGSITSPGDVYFIDRWMNYKEHDGGTPPTIVHNHCALTPGELPGSAYAYKISPNGAGSGYGAGSYYTVFQRIEFGTRYLCGLNKKVTLSFKAKSTIAGKKIGALLRQGYGTGGSPSTGENIAGNNFTLTNDWQTFTVTFTTNTLSGKTFGTANNDFLGVFFYLQWGTTAAPNVNASTAESWVGSGDIYIAQVQLCAGDVALPFEPKSFADELRACQRYYEKSYNYASPVGSATYTGEKNAHIFTTIPASTAGLIITQQAFMVPKRATPNVVLYSTSVGTINTISWNGGGERAGCTASFTSEKGFLVIDVSNATAFAITAGQEWFFQYTADAEL